MKQGTLIKEKGESFEDSQAICDRFRRTLNKIYPPRNPLKKIFSQKLKSRETVTL